jgi:hypothetical protein
MGRRCKSKPFVPGIERIFYIFGQLRPRLDGAVLRFWNRENDEVYEVLFHDAASALAHKGKTDRHESQAVRRS